jgi:branched-subunit amino acid transport protein AzlD
MNKILLYANYVTITFFVLLTVYSFIDCFLTYKDYGISYKITTIVGGEETTRTVTIWEKVTGTIIFLIVSSLLFLDILYLKQKQEFVYPI